MSRYRGRRHYLRSRGHATWRLVRFADDMVVVVKGSRDQAEAQLQQLSERVEALGLRPSRRSLQAVKAKVREITKHTGPDQAPDRLIQRVNRVLRGWCAYFRHGVSSATFAYLRHYAYWRVVGWLRRRHPTRNWRWLRRTYLKERWPSHAGADLFNPAAVRITRYRYRGARIPAPWERGVIATRDHAADAERLEGLIAR